MNSLSDEHVMAVGRVAIAAGQLEAGVFRLAEAVVHHNPRAVGEILKGAQFDRVLTTVTDLVRLKRPGGTWDYFEVWVDEARRAMKMRNTLMHGYWLNAVDGEGGGLVPAIHGRSMRGNDHVAHHPTPQKLQATAATLERLASRVDDLLDEMVPWGGSYEQNSDGQWTPIWARELFGIDPDED